MLYTYVVHILVVEYMYIVVIYVACMFVAMYIIHNNVTYVCSLVRTCTCHIRCMHVGVFVHVHIICSM